jgi:hypothetical protein
VPALVIPQVDRHDAGVGQPTQLVVAGQRLAPERLQRPPQDRQADSRPVGDHQRLAQKQQLTRTRLRGSGAQRSRGLLERLALTGRERRLERFDVRVAGEGRGERLEAAGRAQQ